MYLILNCKDYRQHCRMREWAELLGCEWFYTRKLGGLFVYKG